MRARNVAPASGRRLRGRPARARAGGDPRASNRRGGGAAKTLIAIFFLILLAAPAVAQEHSWRIADFHATIAISENGMALVNERITASFIGVWHGIYRTIPTEYPGPHGTNYKLYLKVTRVADGDGNPLQYELSRQGAYLKIKIYIPGAVDTTKTVQIAYRVRNAIRYFDDYDEFYWNVTGNDWPVPIDHASAFVSLPPQAAGGLRAQAFTGIYGSVERDATADVKDATVLFESRNPLPMRGGLTIDIAIPKAAIHEPGVLTRLGWFLGGNPIVFLPVFAFAVMFTFWWTKGRDPDAGLSVAPMYEPPANISPAEAGTLLDDRIDPRDITSTLVDLAVRGYLKIEETQQKVLLFSHRDYVFHLLKPRDQWQDTQAHERVILNHLFSGGDSVPLSQLKNQFYVAIPVVKEDILSELKSKGMYALDPEDATKVSVLAAILIAVPFVLLQWLGWASFFESAWLAAVAIAVSVLIVFLFARVMPAKTRLGARTRVAILGFQEFMNRVDADRLKRMPPDTFEKYLPYAMALGVEHRWAAAFAGIIKDPPSWYVGPGPYPGMFNPIFFTNSMHSMASSAHEVFVSSPRASSTGSGFGGGGFGGGGGFSGGGFGGGGGGAF
jgi:uncharacterized membrane protein